MLLEDPFAKDDWSSWTEFNKACNLVELVGDDLLIPDTASRVQEAYEKKACDAMLLKLDQVGTVSEAIAAYVYYPSIHLFVCQKTNHFKKSKQSLQLRLVRLHLPQSRR